MSVDPVAPGSRLFVAHSHYIDVSRLVYVAPSLHCSLFAVTVVLETLTRTLRPGGAVFGASTNDYTKVELMELVDNVKQTILGRDHAVHSYTNLTSFTPLFREWTRCLGSITHPAVAHLPSILLAFLRLRVCNDHTLRADPRRYSLYMMALIFLPFTALAEVAEFVRRRKHSAQCAARYLQVRACEMESSVALPLDFGVQMAPLMSLIDDAELDELATDAELLLRGQAANTGAGDGTETLANRGAAVREKSARDSKWRKFDGVYISSLLCALPRAVGALSRQTGRFVLVHDVSEDACEQRLKPFKAMERASNFKHHRGEFGTLIDNALAGTQTASESRGSDRWTGEGVKELRFGRCWLEQQALGSHNLVDAMALALEISVSHAIHMRVLLVDGSQCISVVVGEVGDIIVLCCCGRASHRNDVAAAVDVHPLSQYFTNGASIDMVMQPFRRLFQVSSLPPPPGDETDVAMAAACQSVLRQKEARLQRVREADVAELMVQYGFMRAGAELTMAVLNAFRAEQYDGIFRVDLWPRGFQNRVALLHRLRNTHQWHRHRE